jgi:acyl-CoA synthetase (AMP-forming)/AMP-acid ligase II
MSSWFEERLHSFGEAPAFAWRAGCVSYGAFAKGIERWRRELAIAQIGPGTCLAVRGDFSPGVASLLIAALSQRLIVAAVPRVAPARLSFFLDTARAEGLVDFSATDQPAIVRLPRATAHPLLDRLRTLDAPGLVLFSSGTTGEPKASLLNLERLLDRFRVYHKPKRVLSFLQVDHIGGVNTLFAFLSSGGLLVFPEARDPETICSLVAAHRVQLLPVTPTFLRMMLITEAYKHHDLSALEVVTFGTEPMPPATLRELQRVFPGVSFRQTYGLTELGILPVRTDETDPLWLRFQGEGVETRVVQGTLWVRARTAMLGYLNAEQPFDAEGWFNTHDAIETDGDRLRILGRVTDLINVGGEKVYPAEVEDVLLQMEGVQDACVFGKPSPVTGQVVAARVWLKEPHDPKWFRRSLRHFCRGRLAPYQVPLFVEIVSGPLHGERHKKARPTEGSAPPVPIPTHDQAALPPT